MIVFREIKILSILTLLILVGCLPDSFTKFDEDTPNKAPVTINGGGGTVPGAGTPTCSASAAECNPHLGITMADIEIILGTQAPQTYIPNVIGEITGADGDPSTRDLLAWSINTALPAGMTFNTTTGAIFGEPTGFVENLSVNITATHTPSGESKSVNLKIRAFHELKSVKYDQVQGQLLIITLTDPTHLVNFDPAVDDDNIPSITVKQPLIAEQDSEGVEAMGNVVFIDLGDNSSPAGEMHILVTSGHFKVGDKLSPNSTVFFEDPVTGAAGTIRTITYAFTTGAPLNLTATVLDTFDAAEQSHITYKLNVTPLANQGLFSISTDGTISMNTTDTVDTTDLFVKVYSDLDSAGINEVITKFTILRKDNTPTPKRITNIAMEQKDTEKLIFTFADEETALLFNPDADPQNTFISNQDGKKAKVLQQDGRNVFVDVVDAAGTTLLFKNGDDIDDSSSFFVSKAVVPSNGSVPATPSISHAFSVATATAVTINPILTPSLIGTSGTCDGIPMDADPTGCGVWKSERDTLSFTSTPDINDIGICVAVIGSNLNLDLDNDDTPKGCSLLSNSVWYDKTGECIDKQYRSQESCVNVGITNRTWRGLRYGVCSDGSIKTRAACTGLNTWINDGIIRGEMYYPLSEQQFNITVQNAKGEDYLFAYKMSINSPPSVLSYNNMVAIPVNDVSNFKIGDFVTGNSTAPIDTFDNDGLPVTLALNSIDCRDLNNSKLAGSFSALLTDKKSDDPFWFCPRGVITDIVNLATDDPDPAFNALIVRVEKGFFQNGMELDNVQVFGLGQATSIISDPINFGLTFDITSPSMSGIFAGDSIKQSLGEAVGRIAFMKRDTVNNNLGTLYVNYDKASSNGKVFTTHSGVPATNTLTAKNSYLGSLDIPGITLEQIYATSIVGVASVGDANFNAYDDISFYEVSTNIGTLSDTTGSGIIMKKTVDGAKNDYSINVQGGTFKRSSGAGTISDINPFKTSLYALNSHSTTTSFDVILQLNTYYLYRDQAVTISSNLHDGGTSSGLIKYTVAPALPAGLILNPKTGHITGTPLGKSIEQPYTITATTPFGFANYTLSIHVSDFFGIDYDTASAAGSKPPQSFLVHKSGQKNGRTACRITEDQILKNEGNNRDIVDIQCFVEAAEKDLYEHSLSFNVKVPNNVCSYFVEDPYAFWAFRPTQTLGKTHNVHQLSSEELAPAGVNPWQQAECSGVKADRKVYHSLDEAKGAILANIGNLTPIMSVDFDNVSNDDVKGQVLGQNEYYPNDNGIRSKLDGASRVDWQGNAIFDSTKPLEYLCQGNYSDKSAGATGINGPNCDEGLITKRVFNWTYKTNLCVRAPGHPDIADSGLFVDSLTPDTCRFTDGGYCSNATDSTKADCEAAGAVWTEGFSASPFCVAAEEDPATDSCGGNAASCMAGPATEVLSQNDVKNGVVQVTAIVKQDNIDTLTTQPTYPTARAMGTNFLGGVGTTRSTIFSANYYSGNVGDGNTERNNMCSKRSQCDIQNADPIADYAFTESSCAANGGIWDPSVITSAGNSYQVDFESVQKMVKGGYCSGDNTKDQATCGGVGAPNTFWVKATDDSTFTFNDVQHAFHGARPFYSYSCLDGDGNTLARIRLVVREWNKSYRLTDHIDRYNPDLEIMEIGGNIGDNELRVMDNDQNLLIPNPTTGASTHNDYPDWDDQGFMPFMSHGNFSCEAPALQQDNTADTDPNEIVDQIMRFPGFNAFFQ